MSPETTAVERARWQKDIGPYLDKQGHGQSQIISRLIADVEQAEAERDSEREQKKEWLKGSGILQVQLDQTAAQRDDAVALLRGLGECGCYGDTIILRCEHVEALLASLSTVTEEDWANHQRERAQNAGKTVEEMREKYGLCKQVTRSYADGSCREMCATHDEV